MPSTSATTTSTQHVIPKSDNIYTYSGGNRTVKNYQSSEIINLSTNYAGIGLEGDTFYINPSSGRLAIEDARDKVIEYNTNGNNFAKYSYIASGDGYLDGTWMTERSMLIGADNADNQIAAGAGGCSMWGGSGGYDLLIKTFTMQFNDGGSLSVESQTQSNYWIDGHIMIVDHTRGLIL